MDQVRDDRMKCFVITLSLFVGVPLSLLFPGHELRRRGAAGLNTVLQQAGLPLTETRALWCHVTVIICAGSLS